MPASINPKAMAEDRCSTELPDAPTAYMYAGSLDLMLLYWVKDDFTHAPQHRYPTVLCRSIGVVTMGVGFCCSKR